MKTQLLLLLLIFFPLFSSAQDKPERLIDSLHREIARAKHDTGKINAMYQLGREYIKGKKFEQGQNYALRMLDLSQKIKWEKGRVLYSYLQAVSHGMRGAYEKAYDLLKTVATDLERLGDDRAGAAWHDMGFFYAQQQNLPGSLTCYLQSARVHMRFGNKNGVAVESDLAALLFANSGRFDSAIKYWSQAWDMRVQTGDTLSRCGILTNIGLVYLQYMEPKSPAKAMPYFVRALEVARRARDTNAIYAALVHMDDCFSAQGKYADALECDRQALLLAQKSGDRKAGIAALVRMMDVYNSIGDYPNSVAYGLRALDSAKRINDSELIAAAYNDLSISYQAMNDNPKALDCLLRSLAIAEKRNVVWQPSVAMANIGAVYLAMNEYDKSWDYLQRSLKYDEQHNSMQNTVAYDILADLYRRKKDFGNSLDMAFKALTLNLQAGFMQNASKNMLSLGNIYLGIVQDSGKANLPDSLSRLSRSELLRRAASYLEKAIDIASGTGNTDYLQEQYLQLSEVYTLQHNTAKAFDSYKQYIMFRDSTFNMEKNKAFLRKDMQYTFNAATDSMDAAHRTELAVEQERHNARLRTWFVAAAGLLIIAVITFYFYRKRTNDRFRLQMAEVKQEALIAQLDTHFISDTIDTINSFMEDNDARAASEHLLKFSRLIRTVLGDSLKRSVPLQHDLDILDDYFNLAKLRFPAGHVSLRVTVDDSLDTENTLIPPMILQVLTENAMQHAFTHEQGGLLQVAVYKKGTSVHCVVTDNGVGRAAASGKKHAQRQSYGTGLAEKLVGIWSEAQGAAVYSITDLRDADGNALGTKAEFSFAYITH